LASKADIAGQRKEKVEKKRIQKFKKYFKNRKEKLNIKKFPHQLSPNC